MTSFRKIDVDAYDEDVLQEMELYDPDPHEPVQILRDANSLGDITGALNVVLDSPPYGPNIEEAKNLGLQTVVSVLNSTKSSNVPAVLRSLSPDERDSLMKYIYKGMGMPGWGLVNMVLFRRSGGITKSWWTSTICSLPGWIREGMAGYWREYGSVWVRECENILFYIVIVHFISLFA